MYRYKIRSIYPTLYRWAYIILLITHVLAMGCADNQDESSGAFDTLSGARGMPTPSATGTVDAQRQVPARMQPMNQNGASPIGTENIDADESEAMPTPVPQPSEEVDMNPDTMADPDRAETDPMSTPESMDAESGSSGDDTSDGMEDQDTRATETPVPPRPPGMCPPRQYISPCLFEETTLRLSNSPVFTMREETRFGSPSELTDLAAQQLVFGTNCDGIFQVETTEEAFEYIDAPGIRKVMLRDQQQGRTFTWLKYYTGDTEAGFIFDPGTTVLLAYISDGDIIGCQIPF